MKKAWSFFWLVIASLLAIQVIGAMIQPHLPLIGIVLAAGVLITILIVIFRTIRNNNQFLGKRR